MASTSAPWVSRGRGPASWSCTSWAQIFRSPVTWLPDSRIAESRPYSSSFPITGNVGPGEGLFRAQAIPVGRHRATVTSMRQGICDVRRGISWLASRSDIDRARLGVAGISLGGIVASVAVAVNPAVRDGVFLLAGGDLSQILWGMPETEIFRKSWEGAGRTLVELKALTDPFDPLTHAHRLAGKRLLMIAGKVDEVVPPRSAQASGRPRTAPHPLVRLRPLFGDRLPLARNPRDGRLPGRARASGPKQATKVTDFEPRFLSDTSRIVTARVASSPLETLSLLVGGISMTTLLERAFAEAAKRPEAEQELLASRLLAELAAEDDFDRAIAASTDKLARLAAEALAEHRAGQTEELDPDRL